MLNIKTMNKEARTILKRIIYLELAALSEPDKEFLNARRDYLNKEQLEKFDSVLKKIGSNDVESDGSLESLSLSQLKERAKDLGLKYVAISKEDMIKNIIVAEA